MKKKARDAVPVNQQSNVASITVYKLNQEGHITWHYPGEIIYRDAHSVIIEARFNVPDVSMHGVVLRKGDRFVETYFTDRWYNIFEVHDLDNGQIKCWYCNVSCPAQIEDTAISWVDLALDLLVFPDGRQMVLDEDEFAALNLDEVTRQAALRGLAELKGLEWKPTSSESNGPGKKPGIG